MNKWRKNKSEKIINKVLENHWKEFGEKYPKKVRRKMREFR